MNAHREPLFGVPQKRKRAFFFVSRRPLDCGRIPDQFKGRGVQ
jgi:hypothetical protein